VILVLFATLITQFVTIVFVAYQDHQTQGQFFYVPQQFGTDPIVMKRNQILLPVFLVSMGLGFLMTCLMGVFYSHRLAGPIYKLQDTMEKALRGEAVLPVHLRKNDELHELADLINRLLDRIPKIS